MLDSDEFLKKLHKEVRLVHSSVIYYSGTKSEVVQVRENFLC